MNKKNTVPPHRESFSQASPSGDFRGTHAKAGRKFIIARRTAFHAAMAMALLAGIACCQQPAYADSTPKHVKNRIPDRELSNKKEGHHGMIFPGPGYDPDLGFVIGAVAGYYNNGKRSDPFFAYEPYKYGISYLGSWSTNGLFSSIVDIDVPYVKNTTYRVRTRLSYVRNLNELYFGVGERTLHDLRTPEGHVYTSYSDYWADLLKIDSGSTDAYYNFYLNKFVQGTFNIEKDIWGGLFRFSGGISFLRAWPHDYSGDIVKGKPDIHDDKRENAVMKKTKLRQDFESGAINGFGGGWDNGLRLGLAYDTRDIESNPRKGMFHEAYIVLANHIFGSDFSYSIATLSTRWFLTPLRDYPDFIMALRFACCVKAGDIPFFAMNFIPTTDNYIYGLGGGNTLRGYTQSRFVGPIMAYGNYEFRWIFKDFRIKDFLIELMLVPFVDVGRVYDRWQNYTLRGMKYSYGAGLRTGLNQAFILSFDFGFSKEQQAAFYMNFGTIF